MKKFLTSRPFQIITGFVFVFSLMLWGIMWGAPKQKADDTSSGISLTWDDLAELDYKSGVASPKLLKLNGKKVRIPGFVVPLEDSNRKATEFLLVPNGQACIHVPPPPPNQMVLVKMAGGEGVEMSPYPIWTEGTLIIADMQSMYGKASFRLNGEHTERYRE